MIRSALRPVARRPKLNVAWHARHPMPPRPTLDQRIAWHLAHAEHCGCRPMPPAIRACLRHLAEKRQARA